MESRDRLAVIGGFIAAPASAAHGSWQAAYRLCGALARSGRWRGIDVFHEDLPRGVEVRLPEGVASRLLPRGRLAESAGAYGAIYVANGEQIAYAPHGLRADADPAPVVCEIGTTHHAGQWKNLYLSAFTGTLRETDGLVFKARRTEAVYRQVWRQWGLPFPAATVIPNGVDVATNQRSDRLRAVARRELGLGAGEVAFLCFGRLSRGTKGDHRALLVALARLPAEARLILAGTAPDRAFLLALRTLARQLGVGDQVIVVEDPYEVWPDARERLMSAADVFVHLGTGVEEVSPLVVHEAMAFALPVIAADWAGLPELVADGENGFLVPTHVADPPPALQRALLARDEPAANVELAACVGCDAEAFLRAAALLLADAGRRRAMGEASRRRAETLFALELVAARRVQFLDERARDARLGPAPRELVPLAAVLRGLGSHPLGEGDLVEVAAAEAFAIARALSDDPLLELVEHVLRAESPLPAGELAGRVGAIAPADAGAVARAVVRLVGLGAVRIPRRAPRVKIADPYGSAETNSQISLPPSVGQPWLRSS